MYFVQLRIAPKTPKPLPVEFIVFLVNDYNLV